MTDREQYTPGPAGGAEVRKDGEKWTPVLVRKLRHPPGKVWQALTDPAHLREWAPFDADRGLGTVGATVKLTTVGAPTPQVSETRLLAGEPIGRIVGPEAMKFGGWQRLNAEYAKQFGVETPGWPQAPKRRDEGKNR